MIVALTTNGLISISALVLFRRPSDLPEKIVRNSLKPGVTGYKELVKVVISFRK